MPKHKATLPQRDKDAALLHHFSLADEGDAAPWVDFQPGKGKGEKSFRSKGGSQKGDPQSARTMMDMGEKGRAAQLKQCLEQGKAGRTLFFDVVRWLTGDSGGAAALAQEYSTLTGGKSLEMAIVAKFANQEHMLEYLLDTIKDGEPSLESRLLLSLGKVTNSRPHPSECLELMEDADDVPRLRAWKRFKGDFEKLHKIDKTLFNRLKAAAEVSGAQIALNAKAAIADAGNKKEQRQEREDARAELIDKKVRHLWKKIQQEGGLDEKSKVIALLREFGESEDQATRRHAASPGSYLYGKLEAASKKKVGTTLSKKKMAYYLKLVFNPDGVDDDFVDLPEQRQDQSDAEYADEVANVKQKSANNILNVETRLAKHEAFANSGAKKYFKKFKGKQSYSKLMAEIDALGDKEREGFLYNLLPDNMQAMWKRTQPNHQQYRNKAIALLRKRLVDAEAGAEKEKDGEVVGYGKKIDQIIARFDSVKTDEGFLDKNTVHNKIRSEVLTHARSKVPFSKRSAAKRVLRLLREAGGADRAYVRNDHNLMVGMRKLLKDGEKWEDAASLLGIEANTYHDGSDGQLKVGDAKGALQKKETPDDIAERAEIDGATTAEIHAKGEQAELHPEFWATQLNLRFAQFSDPHRDKVYTLLTEAHYASRQRAELEPTNDGLKPMDEQTFAAEVSNLLDGKAKKKLPTSQKFAKAFSQFLAGKRVSVEERLEQAEWTGKNRLRRAKGSNYNTEAVAASFEDLEGTDLLEEWSDIASFRATRSRQIELSAKVRDQTADVKEAEELKRLNEEIRLYIPDIRSDRFVFIEQNFSPKHRLELTTRLRDKLRSAVSADPECVKALNKEGVVTDELLQERMRLLNQMAGKQRMMDSKAQWDRVSAKGAERKEAGALALGANRRARNDIDLQGDEREFVESRVEANAEHGKDLKEANNDLARRTVNHEKVQAMAAKVAGIVVTVIGIAIGIAVSAAAAVFTAGAATALEAAVLAGLISFITASGVSVAKAGITKALEGDEYGAHEMFFNIATEIGGAALGSVAQIGAVGTLSQAGMMGATNFLSGGDVAKNLGTNAIRAAFRLAIKDIPMEIVKHASSEKPAEMSKFGHASSFALDWTQRFLIAQGFTAAQGAAMQHQGLGPASKFDSNGNRLSDSNGAYKEHYDSSGTLQRFVKPELADKAKGMGIKVAFAIPKAGLGKAQKQGMKAFNDARSDKNLGERNDGTQAEVSQQEVLEEMLDALEQYRDDPERLRVAFEFYRGVMAHDGDAVRQLEACLTRLQQPARQPRRRRGAFRGRPAPAKPQADANGGNG